MKIGIFVCVCDKDMHWFDQFDREAQRIGYPVAYVGDRMSGENVDRIKNAKSTLSFYLNEDQFSERTKQHGMKSLQREKFDWGIQMDIDETFELAAKETLEKSLEQNSDHHIARCSMVTAYLKDGEWMQRVDAQFGVGGIESSRERVYNLSHVWVYADPVTCGAKLVIKGKPAETYKPFHSGITTVHWGYHSKDLCKEHKEKWEDVFLKTFGRNPYSTYDFLTNEAVVPELIPLNKKYYEHLY
jgi:hypothetical protein